MTPFELMVAPNGARLTKTDHPGVPIAPDEIANTAYNCAQAGATAIHVHVRDEQGNHSLDPARYADVITRISAKTDISIQVSTEAAGVFDVDAQRCCLANVVTSDASVALREIARDPACLPETYQMADARGISVQHILYNPDEVSQLLEHFDRNEIPQQSRRVLFVLGRYADGQISLPTDLEPFLQRLEVEPLNWSVCAFGPNEQDCLLAALNHGGHVRIGFENNRIAPDGTVFPSNAAAVGAFVEAAANAGFHPQKVRS